MQYRPGQASDFTHLETFVWQAIFPAFDVPGLTDAQRRENDLMVEQSRTSVLAALEDAQFAVFSAWDERRRALAGYIIVNAGHRPFAEIEQLVVRRADWGIGVGGKLLALGLERIGRHRSVLLAVRAYNSRAIALFQKLGFVDSGEVAGEFEIDRILMVKEAETTAPTEEPEPADVVVEDTAPFPSESDEPYYEALPDYSLASEPLLEPIFDPEESFLDNAQRSQLETFIARAKAIKAGQEAPPPVKRHPEIPLEIVTGTEEEEAEVEEREDDEPESSPATPLSFEFAFGPAPASAPAQCPNCGAEVPRDALFCPTCGHHLTGAAEVLELDDFSEPESKATEGTFLKPEPEGEPDQSPSPAPLEITPATLRSELEDHLGERLTAYFGAEALPGYLRRYRRDEDFHRIRDASLITLARWLNLQLVATKAVRRRKRDTLAELVEYFVVESGSALHGDLFPQRLLRYQGADWKRVDLFRMIMDYLQLKEEELTVYTDFVTTPQKVLKNATASYLRAGKDERVFFVVDQSLFGSGKQGFALTDSNIYWKNVLQPAGTATYTTLTFVEMKEGHLTIDGQFFDAGRKLNLRVALLLDKLRRMDLSE